MPSRAGRLAIPVRRSTVAASCVVARVAPSLATARPSRPSMPLFCAGTRVVSSPSARCSAALTTGITRARIQRLLAAAVRAAPRTAAASSALVSSPPVVERPAELTRSPRARKAMGASNPNPLRARITPQRYLLDRSKAPAPKVLPGPPEVPVGDAPAASLRRAATASRATVRGDSGSPGCPLVYSPGPDAVGRSTPPKERAIVRGRHLGHPMNRVAICPAGHRGRGVDRSGGATLQVPGARAEGLSYCPDAGPAQERPCRPR